MSANNGSLNCAETQTQLAMLLYGELSFDREEQVESHLDGCAACRESLERQRALHAALDAVQIEPSPSLLIECRGDLQARLMEEPDQPAKPHSGWWDQLVDLLTLRPPSVGSSVRWLRPAGALTLIAIGFFAARMTPLMTFRGGPFRAMGVGQSAASRVRTVEPEPDGRIQIVLDETRQRTVAGRMDDEPIRALLLSAARDPSDPGLRAVTVDILNSHAQSAEVRDTLVYALRHDQNAGVRLKAMQGLKPFAGQPEVRSALEQVLLTDSNPGLRTQAIDVLTSGPSEDLDRQMVGTLQELMDRESNAYVRQRSLTVLQAIKASAETY